MAIGIILLVQSILGILGNIFLLLYYLILYYKECTLKIVDLILIHVFTSNFLIILSKGPAQIMAAFGWNQFFNDVGCKHILYIQRLGRSMSISTTCLLSVFQAITISPRNSYWKEIKIKTTKLIIFLKNQRRPGVLFSDTMYKCLGSIYTVPSESLKKETASRFLVT